MAEQTELSLLKERADTMSISYHPTIGLDALKKKVNAILKPEVSPVALTAAQVKSAKRRAIKKENLALVRVVVMNQNPTKKDWKGEFIKVSNDLLGTITKYVPFDIETHIEVAIHKQLKQRPMSRFYTTKNDRGQKVRKYRLVPEFSVSVLDPLTEKELKDLAVDQAKRGAIGDD